MFYDADHTVNGYSTEVPNITIASPKMPSAVNPMPLSDKPDSDQLPFAAMNACNA
jgi:hypothetical protein